VTRRRRTQEEAEEEAEEEDGAEEGQWDDLFDGHPTPSDRRALRRGLAFGFLAMAPLFVLYELAVLEGPQRAAAEVLLLRPLAPFGGAEERFRWVALGVVGIVALFHCVRRHLALGPALLRVPLEGLLGALLLGPLTALLMQRLGAERLRLPGEGALGLATSERAAFVMGAAAWEELVFRVGAYSLIWMLTRRTLAWCGAGERTARWSAECVAPVLSALLFAAFHLDVVLRHLGPGGEPFDAAVFAWRTLAGLSLAILFRWRGPGVAAWTHGIFNLALLLGAGPRVFL
jgi:hypothetical protein